MTRSREDLVEDLVVLLYRGEQGGSGMEWFSPAEVLTITTDEAFGREVIDRHAALRAHGGGE